MNFVIRYVNTYPYSVGVIVSSKPVVSYCFPCSNSEPFAFPHISISSLIILSIVTVVGTLLLSRLTPSLLHPNTLGVSVRQLSQ